MTHDSVTFTPEERREDVIAAVESGRSSLALDLLKVYNYYRIFVGLALLVMTAQTFVPTRLGALDGPAFVAVALGYAIANILITILTLTLPARIVTHNRSAFLITLLDTLALVVLVYLSAGVSSGVGLLVLIAVAAGAILLNRRYSMLLAACATIALLAGESRLALTTAVTTDDLFQAGVLGAICFAFAITIQSLSARLRQNDLRALSQAAELEDLERINRQIVQRMRTGIVLVDTDDNVRMINESAKALLGNAQSEDMRGLPPLLESHLERWRNDTLLRAPPFQVHPNTPEIRVNFSPVRNDDPHGDITIFIEDTTEVAQQAQQLKLAALGRLTASIAHEIRNPLGAISHASQLLNESQNLDKGDARLTDIIHAHCLRMNGVIENVLEMSRRTPPTPARIQLAEFLDDFATEFREARPEAELALTVEPEDTEIRIDKSQLAQALTNLVVNAVRHSDQNGGGPWAGLEGGIDASTGRPYLNVLDRGEGVPSDQIGNLFEPFYTTERTGTGLGLYISRELCEANNARLNYVPAAESDRQLSCFRIAFSHPDRIAGSPT